MRVFPEANFGESVCPICGTSENKPIVLVPILGTEDGNNVQARQYHLDCIELCETRDPESGYTYLMMAFKNQEG